MSEDEGGPTIVVNDLLSFISFKRKECGKDKLLNCLSNFYSHEEGVKAHGILLSSLPEKRTYLKLQTQFEPTNPFLTIYEALEHILEEDFPMFVCKDLNNVPTIANDVKIKEKPNRKSAIRKEHRVIKSQINDVFQTLFQLKEDVQIISEKLLQNGDSVDDSGEEEEEFSSESDFEDTSSEDSQNAKSCENNTRRFENSLMTSFKEEKPDNEDDDKYMQIYQDMKEMDYYKNYKVDGDLLQDAEGPISTEYQTGFYTIKHIFDDYIGYFTIFICSECSFYSNDEDILAHHDCHMTPCANGLKQFGIWAELDFERARQLKKEEKLKEKAIKRLELRKKSAEIAEKRPKSSEVFDKEQRCPLCANKYKVHEWMEHVRYCIGDGTTIPQHHYCNICDVFFADYATLRIHQGYHDESRNYECLQCKFRFLTQADVDKHFNKHIPEKVMKTKCPFCPFPILRKSSLTEHIKTHTGERPHECKICGAKFTNRVKLRKHLNVHNRKEYACDLCHKVFKSQGTLIIHRQYHSAEKPFKCPICNKGFVEEKAMARHHRKHIEEFNCPHCNFRAKSSAALKDHIEKHNNCMLCDFKTTHKNIYLKHMMDHHPEALLSD